MKRTICIVLVVMLLLPAYTAAANPGGQTAFLDISDHWAKDYIMSLFSEGLFSLSPDGNFRPQDPIKVSEFIKLVVVSLGYDAELPQSGNWYDNYIEAAKNMGLIQKLPFQRDYDIQEYDANITRAQMAAVITRALKQEDRAWLLSSAVYSYPDLEGSQPVEYNGYVEVVSFMKIMSGYNDNTFRPDNTATRAEASKVIYCLIEKLKEDKSHSGDYETFDINGVRVETEFSGILPAVKKSLEIIEELDYGYKVIRYHRESNLISVEVFNSEEEYKESQEALYNYSSGPVPIVSYNVSLDVDVLSGAWEPYTLTLGNPDLPVAVETFEQIVTVLLPGQKDYLMQQANKKAKNNKYSVRENRDIEDMNVEVFTREDSEYIVFYVSGLNDGTLMYSENQTGLNDNTSGQWQNQVFEVENTTELLEAIGSDRIIILKAPKYDLLVSMVTGKNAYYEEVYDGKQLVIENVSNLVIKAAEGNTPELLVAPRYANVITFRNVENIAISGIVAGHAPEKGGCLGGVLYFEDSRDIRIDASKLFGSGKEGITLFNVSGFTFSNSEIRECSEGIMTVSESRNISFNNSRFFDNGEYDLITVCTTEDIEFNGCRIYENETASEYFPYMFNVGLSLNVLVRDTKIYNNDVLEFEKHKGSVITENVTFKNNYFDNRVYPDNYDRLFDLSQEDMARAIGSGDMGYCFSNRIDYIETIYSSEVGLDINRNDYTSTHVDGIYMVTPYDFIAIQTAISKTNDKVYTIDEAKAHYEYYMENNKLVFIAQIYGDTPESLKSAEAELVQGDKTTDAEIYLYDDFKQLQDQPGINYRVTVQLEIDIDEIDFNEIATLRIRPNGTKDYEGVYLLDFRYQK